ncbi:hypothetical protein [Acinetobacter sp.]|uniref:hypothetical protein n=1 Tax=Acinetobacter sp. TaxID=472 RepID=UPI003D068936
MKIKEFRRDRMTIEQFAELHDLTMEVHERYPGNWYAHFENSDIKEGAILKRAYGNGVNKENAIKNYADEISGTLLVLNAMSDDRKEIRVPLLNA